MTGQDRKGTQSTSDVEADLPPGLRVGEQPKAAPRRFGDVPKSERGAWITLLGGELYPDAIDQARIAYEPIVERFGMLLRDASSATDLYRVVVEEPAQRRNKMVAVFRRYFTDISTEVLGKKNQVESVIRYQGDSFRHIDAARDLFDARQQPDETLMTILYLNAQRGKTGYALTELFFDWFEARFGADLEVLGPRRAGADLNLKTELDAYPIATKADILIKEVRGEILAVGFARYDAHRGGSQEDDRIKGNNDSLTELMRYASGRRRPTRVLFVNDGPGLLAGSMWSDYAALEDRWRPNVVVCTLKMLDDRLTKSWLTGT